MTTSSSLSLTGGRLVCPRSRGGEQRELHTVRREYANVTVPPRRLSELTEGLCAGALEHGDQGGWVVDLKREPNRSGRASSDLDLIDQSCLRRVDELKRRVASV